MSPPRRILIVDDEADFRAVLAFVLKRAGYDVDSAADGQAGWAAFQASRPDVALLDINMPGLDGKELCRRIRGSPGPRLPVLMLTVRSEVESAAACLGAGADDYILKPFDSEDLLRRVARAMG